VIFRGPVNFRYEGMSNSRKVTGAESAPYGMISCARTLEPSGARAPGVFGSMRRVSGASFGRTDAS
jgi:hypothetical protein